MQCRFHSVHAAVVVRGRESPPRIEKIAISTDLLRQEDTGGVLAAATDILTVYGATTVIVDPNLTPDRRVRRLADTFETVITSARAKRVLLIVITQEVDCARASITSRMHSRHPGAEVGALLHPLP